MKCGPQSKSPGRFLIVAFLALLAGPPLVQTVVEAGRGEWPQALEIFAQPPTPENLRSFDRSLEDASVTAGALRPWMQAAQFIAWRDAGGKALVGREGWLFYQPGVSFLTQRPQPGDSAPHEALAAVVRFRDDLAARGIRLVVMIAPNKESVYPGKLVRFDSSSARARAIGGETRTFLARCEAVGVEVVDLFALYRDARRSALAPLYLSQDSHWSPAGAELAAVAMAGRILERGWLTRGPVAYEARPAAVQRRGDLVRMARSPALERCIGLESVDCTQIVRRDTGALYSDDGGSEVLVLGDSFMRMYQQDEPKGAGFVAHLARALGRPLASIINDGGASTLVRQELFRRPQLLTHTKVVVWEFVERDLRLGTEGWQVVPLPPAAMAARNAPRTP